MKHPLKLRYENVQKKNKNETFEEFQQSENSAGEWGNAQENRRTGEQKDINRIDNWEEKTTLKNFWKMSCLIYLILKNI